MRFQYEQEDDEDNDNRNRNNNSNSANNNNNNNDDSSTIATEHNEKQNASSLGAHVFCGNCGAHVMHADRSSEELEVNANCLLEQQQQQQQLSPSSSSSSSSSSPIKEQQQHKQFQQQTSSMSSLSTIDGEATHTIDYATTSTRLLLQQQQQQLNSVSEHELFLGSAQFWGTLDDDDNNQQPNDSGGGDDDNNINNNSNKPHELEEHNSQHQRTESISSMGEQTHPESCDDYSMDGSSSGITPGAIGGGGGVGASSSSASLSVTTGLLLPPLPPSTRLPPLSSSSESRSVKTLPPWFGERPGYASHPSRSVGGGWSVASIETNDLDSVDGDSSTVSPRMRDQMKFYMSRHMNTKKSERSG